MKILLPSDDIWKQQNQSIRTALGLADDPRFSVQIYTSVAHALSEVCFSLSDLMAFKKTVLFYDKLGPQAESVAVSLSKKEMTLRKFTTAEIAALEYFTPMAKDLLLLATSVDDPVVGAKNDFTFLQDSLKDKKYFHVKISHFAHFLEPVKLPTHYEVLILSLDVDRTLVIAGERAKVRPDLTPKLAIDWNIGDQLSRLALYEDGRNLAPERLEALNLENEKNHEAILAFESDLPKGIASYFRADDLARVFDRSVLVCDGVDGLSLITRLGEYVSDGKGLETTSLCRWQDPKLFEYLGGGSLRGLILIDAKLLNSAFKKLLGKVYKELLAEQNETIAF